MAGIYRRRSDADGDALGVHLFAPVHDVVFGGAHGVGDATLVHGPHLAVDDAAQAKLLRGRARRARYRDVGQTGDAARKRVESAQNSRVVPVAYVHLRAFFRNEHDPRGVGNVVDDAAHDGILQMGVQIDQTRHERRQPEIDHFLFRIAQLQHVHFADIANESVAHEHCAVLERLGRDRQNILCA